MRPRRLNRWQRVAVAGLVLAFGVAAVALLRPSEQSHRVVVASASGSTPSSNADTTSTFVPSSTTSTFTSTSGAPGESPREGVGQAEPCADCGTFPGFPAGLFLGRASRPDDFTGRLTAGHGEYDGSAWDGMVIAGNAVSLELHIRNVSEDVINPSYAEFPNLQIVCAADLTADGHTNAPLRGFENVLYVTNAPLGPGEEGGVGPMTLPMTDADIGPMKCAAVIVAPGSEGRPIARLTHIAPVTFTVVAAQPPTTVAPTTTTKAS